MQTIERHFTVTAYVLKGHQTLLIYHRKLRKWLPPGGHLEANETPPEGVKREVLEETGLEVELIRQENIWLSSWNASSFERPYLCLLENIPPHGNLPAHQHIDLIYLSQPTGGVELPEELEKGELRWFTLPEIELLKEDEEIFSDTKQLLRHILSPTS
jgi:8-oxo-dGTP pyrophosphatase MutT (NUDIX family)